MYHYRATIKVLLIVVVLNFFYVFSETNPKENNLLSTQRGTLLSGPLLGIGFSPSNNVDTGEEVVNYYSIIGYSVNYNIQPNLRFNPVIQFSLLFTGLEEQQFNFQSSFLIGVNMYDRIELAFGLLSSGGKVSFASNFSFYFDDSKKIYYPLTVSFAFNSDEINVQILAAALWF